jgi:hypothetical protein
MLNGLHVDFDKTHELICKEAIVADEELHDRYTDHT